MLPLNNYSKAQDTECDYVECLYAECHYSKCCGAVHGFYKYDRDGH